MMAQTFDRAWRMACDVRPISRDRAEWMIRRHYLGRWPGVCVLSLGLNRGADAIGVIVFALPPRETAQRYGGVTWELARLWIDDAVPRNAETYLIGAAVRHIRRYHPDVRALVSYADPSAGHAGTIYRAANWTADGRTDQDRTTPRIDYVNAESGKKYSRRSHVPSDADVHRVPRISKHRFVLRLPRTSRRADARAQLALF